jgi:hypothetical protein
MTIFVLMRVKLLLAGFVLDFTSASCGHILTVTHAGLANQLK